MSNPPSLTSSEPVSEPALTPTERRLWDTLRRHPGRVFTRSELVALVMPDTIVLERTIDVHIKALRKKCAAAAERIRTVRRVGPPWSAVSRSASTPHARSCAGAATRRTP